MAIQTAVTDCWPSHSKTTPRSSCSRSMSTATPQRRFDEQRLLRAYRGSGDPHLREQLVERYLPLARSLARRYRRAARRSRISNRSRPSRSSRPSTASTSSVAPRSAPMPSRLSPARSSATPRRRLDGAPASRRAGPRGQRRPCERRAQHHHRGAGHRGADRRARLDVYVEAVVEAREASRAVHCESLDRPHRNGDDEGGAPCSTRSRRPTVISHGCATAHPRDAPELARSPRQPVVQLYYQHNLTQAEIGERLGYSQMHISRICATRPQLACLARLPPPRRPNQRGLASFGPASRLLRAVVLSPAVRAPCSLPTPVVFMIDAFAQARHGLWVGGTNRGGQGIALSLTMPTGRGLIGGHWEGEGPSQGLTVSSQLAREGLESSGFEDSRMRGLENRRPLWLSRLRRGGGVELSRRSPRHAVRRLSAYHLGYEQAEGEKRPADRVVGGREARWQPGLQRP